MSALGLLPVQTSYAGHTALFLPSAGRPGLGVRLCEDRTLFPVSAVWLRVSGSLELVRSLLPFTSIKNDSCLQIRVIEAAEFMSVFKCLLERFSTESCLLYIYFDPEIYLIKNPEVHTKVL